MGVLNNAGFAASIGDFIMLLNDDVTLRTAGWDATVSDCFRRFPDPFVLVHVNDTLMREHLCTFPLTSRAFYELTGGACAPPEYRRYRIDDHVEDVFNLLAVLGERRVLYLPDVVFEHDNAVHHPEAGGGLYVRSEVSALDAPLFDPLLPRRKELALRVILGDSRAHRGAACTPRRGDILVRPPLFPVGSESCGSRGGAGCTTWRRRSSHWPTGARKRFGELVRAVRRRLFWQTPSVSEGVRPHPLPDDRGSPGSAKLQHVQQPG